MQDKFSTDNAAPCWGCQGTVATYDVYQASDYVDVYCHGCGRRSTFDRAYARCATPAETSAAHRSTYPRGGPAKVAAVTLAVGLKGWTATFENHPSMPNGTPLPLPWNDRAALLDVVADMHRRFDPVAVFYRNKSGVCRRVAL